MWDGRPIGSEKPGDGKLHHPLSDGSHVKAINYKTLGEARLEFKKSGNL